MMVMNQAMYPEEAQEEEGYVLIEASDLLDFSKQQCDADIDKVCAAPHNTFTDGLLPTPSALTTPGGRTSPATRAAVTVVALLLAVILAVVM